MSILSVDTISPIGSGTTLTLNATETKVNNFITVGTGASVSSPSSNVLTLGTNSSERLRIASDGKVGIGTDNPTAHLQVYRKTSFASNPIIQARSNNGSTNELKFEIDGDGDAYFNGKVGIGTDNPLDSLHISNASPGILITDTDQASNTKNWSITAAVSQVLRIQAQDDSNAGGGNIFDFYRVANQINEFRGLNSGNTWFVVDNLNQKVGISSATPTNVLTVHSNDNNQFAIKSGDGNADIVLAVNGGSARIRHSNTNFEIWTGGVAGSYYAQSSARRMQIDNSGNTTLNTGNLVIGTSGKGIDFSATSDATGNSSELLDDYEEGSWTPASKNAGSFTSSTGRYVKIGQQVTVWGYIAVVTDITSTSNFEISGLPYTATSTAHTEFVGPVMIRWINSTGATGVSFSTYQASGWNYLRIYASRDDGNNYDAVKHSDFAFDTAGIRFCHSYTV